MPAGVNAATIKLNKKAVTLKVGQSTTLKVKGTKKKVTDVNDKANYIPKGDRIAVFDMDSDTSMMNYALDKRNPYPTQAYMVVADDDVREWGTQDWAKKSADYIAQGYIPVSMKNDFAQIYPKSITRAELQYQ